MRRSTESRYLATDPNAAAEREASSHQGGYLEEDTAEFAVPNRDNSPLVRLPEWSLPLLLVCAGWFLFGWHVGERGLWSAHEGRAAQNAQNMLDTGQWLVPRLFTEDFELQKPPLYYWTVALLSMPIGEVIPLTVRAPSTLAAILGLILVYYLGRRMWNTETGVGAVVVLATCTRYAWVSRVGRIDMPLAVLCLGALFLAWVAITTPSENSKSRLSWWFYVLNGVGLLLKGPVVLVFTMLPLLGYLLFSGEPVLPVVQGDWKGTWRRYRFLPGIALAFAIASPWFLLASLQSGGSFFWQFFVYHNLDRALGTSDALKSGPIWFYIPRLIVDCFPWCLLFGPLTVALWRSRRKISKLEDKVSQTYMFLLCWLGTHFLFLSLVSFKRADYLLPAFPALALLISGWLRDRFQLFEQRIAVRPPRNLRRRNRTILLTAFLLALVTAPLMIWGIIEFLKKGLVKSILKVELISEHLNETDRFMMHHVERMIRESWPLLGITMVVIVACLWIFHTGWHNRRNRWILAGMAGPWLATFLFHIHVLLPPLDRLRDMARFAETVRTVASERPVYYFGKFDDDLVFYAGKPARLLGHWEELVQLGQSTEPCFVVMKKKHLPWVHNDARLSHWIVVADNRLAGWEHRQPRVLLTNNPLTVSERLQRDITRQ